MKTNYKRTRFTCFFTFPALTPAFVLPPILFATFRQMYGISYTLLGTLVLVNFCTQLGVDLIFAFSPGILIFTRPFGRCRCYRRWV